MLSGTVNPGAKASCRSLNPFICSYLALGTVKDGLEVFNALGESIAVVAVRLSDIEPVRADEVLAVRELTKAG
jgi:hypothetical protein